MEEPIFVNGNKINKESVKPKSGNSVLSEKKLIRSYDSKLELSNFVDSDGKVSKLMIDSKGRKYKKCSYCKHWYSLSNFDKSTRQDAVGGVKVICNSCKASVSSNNKKHYERMKSSSLKQKDDSLDIDVDKTLGGPVDKILSYLPDEKLLEEIKKRGYVGTLSITKKINL